MTLLNSNFLIFHLTLIQTGRKRSRPPRKKIYFAFAVRGLYDSEMIQCTQCFEWNHFRCLEKQITKSLQKPDCQFKCSQCNQFSVRKKKSKYVAQTVTVSDKIGTRYKTFISLSPYTHGYMRKQNAVIILKFDYRCTWDAGIRAQIVSAVYRLHSRAL